MSSATSREPVGRRGRYAAAITTNLEGNDPLQGSTSVPPPQQNGWQSTAAPQPVHRRRTVDITAPTPTAANVNGQPMAPHPPTSAPPPHAGSAGSFDFGFDSLGIPAGNVRRRYNSMPTASASMAPGNTTTNGNGMNGSAPNSSQVRHHKSAPEMRRQNSMQMAQPSFAGSGALPNLPSNMSRNSLVNNPSASASGPYVPTNSAYGTMPGSIAPSQPSLYNLQRHPTNLTSTNSAMMSGAQDPSFASMRRLSQQGSMGGSFMAPAGASGTSYPASSSSASSTGSSTLQRDISFLGLDTIATDSFRGDASRSQYAPASSYNFLAASRGPGMSGFGMPGSFLQPAGGGSMMMPAGSGGFAAGHGTSMNPYDSMYAGSRASFGRYPSQFGSQSSRSFGGPTTPGMADQSFQSLSLLGANAFHPELARFQDPQRSAHMAITPLSASTPRDGSSASSDYSAASLASAGSVTRWVKPEEGGDGGGRGSSTSRRSTRRGSAPSTTTTTTMSKTMPGSSAQNPMDYSVSTVAKFLGLDYVGPAAVCAGVSALTILEHQNASPSDRACVHSSNGYDISIAQHGATSRCATNECVWRLCGTTGLSSTLVKNAARRFAEEGENAFIWVVDRASTTRGQKRNAAAAAPANKPTDGAASDLLAALCMVAVDAAMHSDSGSVELVVSAIRYHPPKLSSDTREVVSDPSFTELLGSTASAPRSLEVATSPITGSCVNGCVGIAVTSTSDFDDLASRVRERLRGASTEESLTLWQLNLLQRRPSSGSLSAGASDDVVLSSFTVAGTSSPALVEAVLDQNAKSQWSLFKYGLGHGPCTVLAVLAVEETDQEAAATFSVLERLRYHGHLGPRPGSVQGWIDEAAGRIAELDALDDMLLMDAVSGAAAGAHHTTTTVYVREKLHQQRKDFQAFMRKPSLAAVPLYVVEPVAPREAKTLCSDEADSTSRLSGVPPFFSAYVRRRDDSLAARTAASALIEALGGNVVVVRQDDRPGQPFGGFEESLIVPEGAKGEDFTAALTQSTAVANLESFFLKGFNTSVIGLSPIPLASDHSTTSRLGGSAPGDELALPGVKSCVGLAVRSVFDKIEKQRMGTVLRCSVSMYHVRDTDVVDLLDGAKNPTFAPLTLVISPLLGTAPNLVTQRAVQNARDYDTIVGQGLRQLRVVNRQSQDSDKEYLSYTVIAVELKQTRKNYPDDVYVSVMAGVSLGENYNVLGDPSLFYDKTHVGAPCVSLLKSFLTQCARSHCIAFLDEAATMEVATLLDRLRDLKQVETRPIVVGSTKRLVNRLTKILGRLKADQRFTSRGKENVSRVEGMLNDAAQLLDTPATTDAVYYLRWADDDETLTLANGGANGTSGPRRSTQVNVQTPSTTNGRARSGSATGRPSSASSTSSARGRRGSQPDAATAAQEAGRYDEALEACRSTERVTHYYGTQYKKDPLFTAPSDPANGLRVPSLVVLRSSRAEEDTGVAQRSETEVEVWDTATSTTTSCSAGEVVAVGEEGTARGTNGDAALQSASLDRSIGCVAGGHTAAVLLCDTAPLTAKESVGWLTVQRACSALLAKLEAAPSVPFLLSARAVLLPDGEPNALPDLLGDNATVDVLKYSPVCGPTCKDAEAILLNTTDDVDTMLDRILSELIRRNGSRNARVDLRGAVAIQLVVHQFVPASASSPSKSAKTKGDSDDDMRMSCLWLVCGDSFGDWLSATTSQPKSCTARLLDFWLGGPCFTTSVLAVTTPSSISNTAIDINLRRRFDRLVKVQDAFRAVSLGTPRDGSVAHFEAYLTDLKEKCGDATASPRLTAMLSEVSQLRQKSHAKFVASGKAPGLLAHEPKMFTMMDA